jgi:hypothetical protein
MSVSKEEFTAKIEHIGDNLYIAHFHLKIHEKMTIELNKRLSSYPDFYGWSRMAHYEAGVLRLTKAYDKDSLGLFKVINIFQSNHHSWISVNPADAKTLKKEMENDLDFLNSEDLIQKLVHLRNKVVAHTDKQLYPQKLSFNIFEIYEGDWIYKDGRLTTNEIEKLPPNERDEVLMQKSLELYQAVSDERAQVLGQEVPSFSQFYELTEKGVDICNRYMARLGIDPIELKLSGIT